MPTIIKCRARVTDTCLHDRSSRLQFGEDAPLDEDGTFDGSTIVCDACYMRLCQLTPSGAGLRHELDAAIVLARSRDSAYGIVRTPDLTKVATHD